MAYVPKDLGVDPGHPPPFRLPETVVADLAARFPENRLVSDQRKLEGDLEKILCFIANPAAGLDLDLDIYGTPFQRRVWDALCAIPSSRT